MGTVTLALGCAGCGFVSDITIEAPGPEEVIVGKDLLDKFRRQHAAQVSRGHKHEIVLALIVLSSKLEPRLAIQKIMSLPPPAWWLGI